MRILITYDPGNEAVEKTAKQVAEFLRRAGADVELVDITRREVDILVPYDKLVVGGHLWFGKFSAPVQKYLAKNKEEMLLKQTYIFVHAYVGNDKFQEQVAKLLPMEVLTHAYTFNLGMSVDTDSMNPLDRIRWNLSRQSIETPADDKLVKQFVEFVLQ